MSRLDSLASSIAWSTYIFFRAKRLQLVRWRLQTVQRVSATKQTLSPAFVCNPRGHASNDAWAPGARPACSPHLSSRRWQG